MPPKVLRRPGAAKAAPKRGAAQRRLRAGQLRRPARVGAPPEVAGVEVLRSEALTVEQCRGLKDIQIADGSYWEQAVEAAGQVQRLVMEDGEMYLEVKVLGTMTENLLRAASGLPGRVMKWHVCHNACTGLPHEEGVVHVRSLKRLGPDREAWMSNLVEPEGRGPGDVDELQHLRAEKERLAPRPPGVEAEAVLEEATPAKGVKKKKKKKRGLKVESTKGLAEVFQHTGLDPNPKVRKKFRKKAAKLARKKSKGSTDSSSSSSNTSTEDSMGDPSLFGAAGRVQLVGKRYPGTLLAAAAEEAAESLLTTEGGIWDPSTGPLVPIFTRYYRAQLQSKMSPAMSREALTLAVGLDLGLRGKIAELLDLMGQRLKALELQATGTHYTVAQQSELVPKEAAAMTSQVEIQQAARRARDEGKTRMEASRPFASKQKPPGKGEEAPKGAKGKGGKGKAWKGDGNKQEHEKQDPKKKG